MVVVGPLERAPTMVVVGPLDAVAYPGHAAAGPRAEARLLAPGRQVRIEQRVDPRPERRVIHAVDTRIPSRLPDRAGAQTEASEPIVQS